MDLERIKSLIDAMAASDLAEMHFAENGWSLRLVRGASGHQLPVTAGQAPIRRTSVATPKPVVARPAQPAPNLITAPMFGVVYLRPSPDAPDFVTPGQAVTEGAVLCVVEAMKVFNEVRAPRSGIVAELLVTGGQEIEAGQALMRLNDV